MWHPKGQGGAQDGSPRRQLKGKSQCRAFVIHTRRHYSKDTQN